MLGRLRPSYPPRGYGDSREGQLGVIGTPRTLAHRLVGDPGPAEREALSQGPDLFLIRLRTGSRRRGFRLQRFPATISSAGSLFLDLQVVSLTARHRDLEDIGIDLGRGSSESLSLSNDSGSLSVGPDRSWSVVRARFDSVDSARSVRFALPGVEAVWAGCQAVRRVVPEAACGENFSSRRDRIGDSEQVGCGDQDLVIVPATGEFERAPRYPAIASGRPKPGRRARGCAAGRSATSVIRTASDRRVKRRQFVAVEQVVDRCAAWRKGRDFPGGSAKLQTPAM